MIDSRRLGWTSPFPETFQALGRPDWRPGRVLGQARDLYRIQSPDHPEAPAVLAGRLRHEHEDPGELPAVGDWVALEPREDGPHRIHQVLPRRTCLRRNQAGTTSHSQVVAANVDEVWVVAGGDGDWNLRRLERYLLAIWDSGARPVLVLTKLDACPDPDEVRAQVEGVAPGVAVHWTCALDGRGLEPLRAAVPPGAAVALVGSSGVGKSTLVNALLGEERQATGAARRGDGKGRHTTTARHLVALPEGGLLIDTPGMRELHLHGGEAGLPEAFADVEAELARCRFRDCRHSGEPGCGIGEALERGDLAPARWRAYLSLAREVEAESQRVATRQRQQARKARRRARPSARSPRRRPRCEDAEDPGAWD